MEYKRKLLIICGPTATGKTALGIKLAKKFNGEIVSADSRQVYQGMDIGTGKDIGIIPNSQFPIPNEFSIHNFQIGYYLINGIQLWLYDIVKPDYQFSVADYVKCANAVIEDIWQREKLPIIVGGTGLYIKGLIDGIGTMGIKPDWELRKKFSHCSVVQLSNCLEKLDKQKLTEMNNSDRNNPRRLIRAIEIIRQSTSEVGGTPPKARGDTSEVKEKNVLFIGLTAPYKTLYQRIDKRVDQRIKQGVVEEIRKLLKRGYDWKNSVMGTTIGYKEWKKYFSICHPERSEESRDKKNEVIQKWKFAEHAYARRQMTWFRKDKRIKWFNINNKDFVSEIVKLVDGWYNKT